MAAILLPIYNDPHTSDADLTYARVHLTFTDRDTRHEVVVGNGWWLNQRDADTTLCVGDEKHVILLATLKDQKPSAVGMVTQSVTDAFGGEIEKPFVRGIFLTGNVYDIKACLISGRNSEYKLFHTLSVSVHDLLKRIGGQ